MATDPAAIQHGRLTTAIQNGRNPPSTEKTTRNYNKNQRKNNKKSRKYNKKRTSPNPASAQQRTSSRTGKCLNFVQINTNKAKRATDDLVLFSRKFSNVFSMAQEPYVNGKNIIPQPTSDLKVLAWNDRAVRPRACVYYHKSLANKLWYMDSLSTGDCVVVQTRVDNVAVLMVSCYMDRNDADCPPQAFKNAVNHAKRHGMALVAGTDANAQNTA